MTTGADLIARRLAIAGASRAFGIPGGEVLALVAALERASIRFHLAKHENAAGFMAEGHWHATGTLPVLVATLGPGVANAVNVVANAQQDRVPLIFLTGCVDAEIAESYTHQVFDHAAVLRPIVKASLRAAPGTEDLVIDKAIAIALDGRPGPVHIDLPTSVAESAVAERPVVVTPRPRATVPADLAAARDILASATRPLVIAGLDIVNEGSAAELSALIAASGAPLITTYKAKGVIPEDGPQVIGAAGLSPKADALVRPLVDQADAIVLAGYDPIEMRAGWRSPWPADKPVIDIVAEALPHGMHSSRVLLEGHVGRTLALLSDGLSPRAVWPDGLPANIRAELRAAFTPPAEWGPHAVFETLRAAAPPDVIATVDSGAHRILMSEMWSCRSPRTLLQSTGLCTMGCALPLAIGAALGAPSRPVLCVVGDAGLEMVAGELATLRDLRLPVVIAVLVDESLALIELKQRQAQLANAGVDFGGTDFPAVSRGFGGFGVAVESRAELERAAREAFAREGFSLIACRVGRRAYDGAF